MQQLNCVTKIIFENFADIFNREENLGIGWSGTIF